MINKEIDNSNSILNSSKTILYPTDTVWGIGCDATNHNAVSKIYKIKHRAESKSLVILVDSLNMLQQYVNTIPAEVKNILELSNEPTTIIYQNPILTDISSLNHKNSYFTLIQHLNYKSP